MKTRDLEEYSKKINGNLYFDYSIKKLNWFNIGGKTKIFFKPETLKELSEFLKIFNKRGKVTVIGAGSNILFSDDLYDGVIIKLSKRFNNLSILNKDKIIAGAGVLDKKLSDFACEMGIGGLEFLSCIPGSVGGGIRMNSGCFGKEFKDVLLSVQTIDENGRIATYLRKDMDFFYRGINLSHNLIFLSGTFKGSITDYNIRKKIIDLKSKKDSSQPSKIKTGGSTFKNPVEFTNKKAWELIKEYVPLDTKFGDAEISKKHCNFFVNTKNAKFDDMINLINFVKKKIKEKTNIDIELEIKIID
ncbi:MAG: UDP-N-acetylmuramate dehydrogenase [Candidatus Pelagibacter sp.]|tara:strand:+ start:1452 stop:2357 length:906 start_codon:yes stop_codon:yes gene_type:complete